MRTLQLRIEDTKYPANIRQHPGQLVTTFLVDVFAQLHATGNALDIDLIMRGETVVFTMFYLVTASGGCLLVTS